MSAAHVLCTDPFGCEGAGSTSVRRDGGDEIGQHEPGASAGTQGLDIAYARLHPGVRVEEPNWSAYVPSEQLPTGEIADEVYKGAQVWKLGAASGYTTGEISSRRTTIKLEYSGVSCWVPAFAIKPTSSGAFSVSGDSGAAVFYQSGHAVGLVFAGRNKDLTYATPLTEVFKQFGFAISRKPSSIGNVLHTERASTESGQDQ